MRNLFLLYKKEFISQVKIVAFCQISFFLKHLIERDEACYRDEKVIKKYFA